MDGPLIALVGIFVFALGSCIGSFLNVVVWRVPRGESLVSPPSHCPKCNAPIRWYQNIPILAWLALGGRCANCRAPISPRYILVEALTGCLFLAAFANAVSSHAHVLGLPDWWIVVDVAVAWTWISLMVVGSFIDYDLKLLPDFVTVGGMVLGFFAAAAESSTVFACRPDIPVLVCARALLVSLSGLAVGFGLLALVRKVGSIAFKREAMGMGDVFLMGAVGALYGPVAVLFTLVVSSIAGSIFGVGLILLSKTRLGSFLEIPFGPYICIGCLAWMFRGPEIVNWYVKLLTF